MPANAQRTTAIVGAKAERDAAKTTNLMLEGFAGAMDAALEAEIECVVQKFRQTPALLYSVAGLMKNDSLTALLDGRGHNIMKESANAPLPIKVVKLRRTARKWKHLKEQPAVATKILEALEPDWFVAGAYHASGLQNYCAQHA